MKKIAGFAALLLTGVAAPALAQTAPTPPAAAHATTDCTGPEHTWQNFGADKFARSEEEGMRKLPEALGHMVAFGCITQQEADVMLATVRAHPEGMQGPVLPVLNAGVPLMFSESGSAPSVNVVIGEHYVQPGVVAGVQMRVWTFRNEATGRVISLLMPLVCFNWSLQVETAPPPPPPPPPARVENDCVVIDVAVNAPTDASIHGAETSVDQCTAYRPPSGGEWRTLHDCPDDCLYDAVRQQLIQRVGSDHLAIKFKVPVTETGFYQFRVSRRFATNRRDLAVFCLELDNGRQSDGVVVWTDDYLHYDEFDQDIAVVSRTARSMPEPLRSRNEYFRFSH